MREGMYMITKITSGAVVERRKSYVGRRPSRRGARRKGASAEKKQENNIQQAVLALARVLNCNFSHRDALVTLSFGTESLEKCGGEWSEAVKLARNFLDRVARRMKKHGEALRWVMVPSEVDGETGEVVRFHVHAVMSGSGLRLENGVFYLYDEALDEVWKHGTADVQMLRHQKDYYPLAQYLIRQARRIPDGKKYSSSRNMKKPKIEHTYVTTAAQLRVPVGASVLAGTRFEPEKGVNVVRYIPAERKDVKQKIGGRKEMAIALSGEPAEEGGDDGV